MRTTSITLVAFVALLVSSSPISEARNEKKNVRHQRQIKARTAHDHDRTKKSHHGQHRRGKHHSRKHGKRAEGHFNDTTALTATVGEGQPNPSPKPSPGFEYLGFTIGEWGTGTDKAQG